MAIPNILQGMINTFNTSNNVVKKNAEIKKNVAKKEFTNLKKVQEETLPTTRAKKELPKLLNTAVKVGKIGTENVINQQKDAGQLLADMTQEVDRGYKQARTTSLADFIATTQAKPELTSDDIKTKFPEFKGQEQSLADFMATMEAKPNITEEEIQQKFPEFYQLPKTPDQKIKDTIKKGTEGLKTANEFIAGGIEGVVGVGGQIENRINEASDYLLGTNAVADAKLRDERLAGKSVFSPFGLDSESKATKTGKMVGDVVGKSALIPSGTAGGTTVASRLVKNGLLGAANTQAGTLLTEGRFATPTETAIGAATQSVFGTIANKKSTSSLTKLIQPKLTPTVEADLASKGLKSTNILGKVVAKASPREKEMVQVAKTIGLNPNKTVVSNVNKTIKALNDETDDLIKVVKDSTYTYDINDITTRMNKVEKPISLRGTDLEKQYNQVKKIFKQMLEKEPDKSGAGLLKVRKEFDKLISKEYPNLYNSDTLTPLKIAITNLRKIPNEVLNDNIGGDVVKASLKKSSLLIDMIDNLASKSEKTGTTGIGRFINNNRGKLGAAGALGGAYLLKKMGIGGGGGGASSYVPE